MPPSSPRHPRRSLIPLGPPVKVSQHFKLGRTQGDLDFVDVDIQRDAALFLDPYALRTSATTWAEDCVRRLQDFFSTVLNAIRSGDHARARVLLSQLSEPNETHLGLSKGRSRGHAIGRGRAREVWASLCDSEAVKSGLLVDLEDAALMVPGIRSDLVSDITTNVIREPLIHYTQESCRAYDIPLTRGVQSGPLWDPLHHRWANRLVSLPMARGRRLLLVPKAFVRTHIDYDPDEYYREFILPHLREQELATPNSELVHLLKDKKGRIKNRKVYGKDIRKKYGDGKSDIVELTRQNPQLLADYRKHKRAVAAGPLAHWQLGESPRWSELLTAVKSLPPGNDNASAYHLAVEKLLSALFYPSLIHPQMEYPIHDGRKRIDITYTNDARAGFFRWAAQHYPAPLIFTECKNYTRDVANPELDQLGGRFSANRGRVGLLLCRKLQDKDKFLQRCRDTAQDGNGFIIALDDDDLTTLVDERSAYEANLNFTLLRERFEKLIR